MDYKWIAALGLLVAATGTQAQVYTQGFSSNTNGFVGGVAAVTPSGEHYLQLANSDTATLTVNTAGYTGLNLSFNLYGIQSVDGNGPYGGGADPFQIFVNGSAVPTYDINIANFGGDTQSYNGVLSQSGPGQTYDPLTGAVAVGTLGYGTGGYGDSTYNVSFALPDSAITSITFVGATNEARTDPTGTTTNGNEAYGIDNVSLTGTFVGTAGAVPEPASWAMMILGMGAIGFATRRRNVTTRVSYAG